MVSVPEKAYLPGLIVIDGEQIVGRERRERVSQLAWCGEGCSDSRRRVNSDVIPSPLFDCNQRAAAEVGLVDEVIAIAPDESANLFDINQQVSAKNEKTGCDIVRIIEVARFWAVRGVERLRSSGNDQ